MPNLNKQENWSTETAFPGNGVNFNRNVVYLYLKMEACSQKFYAEKLQC